MRFWWDPVKHTRPYDRQIEVVNQSLVVYTANIESAMQTMEEQIHGHYSGWEFEQITQHIVRKGNLRSSKGD
eukprot:2912361-Amphidinium_carterae.2